MKKNIMIPSVTFFYPSRILGGAEILFIRLAKILAIEWNIKVYYIDYQNGFAKKTLELIDEIEFIDFSLHKKITNIPEDTVIITPLSCVLDIATYIRKSNPKILFWSIHPVGLENFLLTNLKKLRLPIFKLDYKKIGEGLDFFAEKFALYFMDGPNFFYQKRVFQLKENSPDYLPILCDSAKLRRTYLSVENGIKLAWLGRLSEEKIYPLVNILNYCNQFLQKNETETIDFHVIGKGSFDFMVERFQRHPNLNIIRQENLSGESLNEYLVENIDVLFAMGTSALEGASMRIATILVDFSYEPIETGNKFRWLYESVNYSLGDLYNSSNNQAHTFNEIMGELGDGRIKEHSEQCFNYVIENHSPEVVGRILIDNLQKAQLNHSDLLRSEFKSYFWINAIREKFHYFKYICKKS